MNTKTNTNNKFCKVCFDAGKDESIYKSHYVKNNTTQKGIVVCPTLLNQRCRYCHMQGHTLKYCKSLLEKEKRNNKMQRQYEYNKKQAKVNTTSISTTTNNQNSYTHTHTHTHTHTQNQFASLIDDDTFQCQQKSSEQPLTWSKIASIEDTSKHSSLSTLQEIEKDTTLIGLERPKLQRQTTMIYSSNMEEGYNTPEPSNTQRPLTSPPAIVRKRVLNWADISDSDDD